MSATAATTVPTVSSIDTTSQDQTQTSPLWRTGALAGIAAAVATTVVAAVALAADVPLEIDGEQIPLVGFGQATLMAVTVGFLLAKALVRWTAKPSRNFVAATVGLTALSIVPDFAIDATTATKLVLIATHLVAAAIVIPTVAARLANRQR